MKVRQFFNFSSKEFDSRIKSTLKHLQREKDFCDVTISCDGRQIDAHKAVLARGSLVFNNILKLNPQSHPLIFLSDVKFSYLLNILDFMYQGEVSMDKGELDDFLVVARDLKINDLTEEAFKDSKQSIEEKTKKQRLACSPKQQLNLDYKIKNENKLDDFHSIVDDLKVDALEDVEQFADEDFDNFEDEAESINIKEHPMNRSSNQDFNMDYNIKIELEMENKNTEKNEKTIPTQDPVNVNEQCSELGLRIRDVAKLLETKSQGLSILSKKDISKSGFECEHCKKTYSSKINLKTHVLAVHERRKYSCTKCDFKATSKQYLKTHILSIHEGIRYPCSHCDYKASHKKHLKTHIQSTHEGVKYPCSHCDYKATTNGHLKTHIQSTHEGMRYPCSHCDYKATTKETLKTHIRNIHEGIRYPCSHCDYKATTKETLKAHIRNIHEGIRYPCSQCNYKASYKEHLKTHIRSIHEGMRYPCSYCDYKATQKSHLKTHISKLHL